MTGTSVAILVVGATIAFVAAAAAVRIDLVERRLPNRLVGTAGVAAWVTSAWLVQRETADASLTRIAVCVGVIAGPLLILWLISPSTIGGGDVKLAGALAPLAAWPAALHPVTALFAMFILATPQALMVTRSDKTSTLAFGPYIAAGIAAVVIANVALQ